MAKYLFSSKYTPEAAAAVREAGYASRIAATNAMAASVGGTVESIWFTTGDWSVHIIFDFPSEATAFAIESMAWATGNGTSIDVQPLFTPAEADAAIAAKVDFIPPGS